MIRKVAADCMEEKKKGLTFTIDCAKRMEGNIIEIASLEKFLQERIQVGGKPGALGDSFTVVQNLSSLPSIRFADDNIILFSVEFVIFSDELLICLCCCWLFSVILRISGYGMLLNLGSVHAFSCQGLQILGLEETMLHHQVMPPDMSNILVCVNANGSVFITGSSDK